MDKYIQIPNLILVGSTARKQGKTSFVCDFIREFNSKDLIVIKVTNHIFEKEFADYLFRKENKKIAQGDTLRMLNSGAENVFYTQMINEHWNKLVSEIQKFKNKPIICESAWLRNYIKPGLFIMFDSEKSENKKSYSQQMLDLADVITNYENYKSIFKNISFLNNEFIYTQSK